MQFGVSLIKSQPLDQLTGVQVYDLFINAEPIAGLYWIFEGEPEALSSPVEVIAEGVTEGTFEMDNGELVAHCAEIFDFDFSSEKTIYQMQQSE